MKNRRGLVMVLLFACLSADRASAVNGLQLIGFSADSTALAGSVHVAVADTSSIYTNPAAMSLIGGTLIDVSAGPLQVFLHHSDGFGNDDHAGERGVIALGDLGLATRIAAFPRLTVGAGLFTQGGFGTDFKHL